MKLTGKCKKEFEEWYLKSKVSLLLSSVKPDGLLDNEYLVDFYWIDVSMQIGVYQLYFDSLGIEISTNPDEWIIYLIGEHSQAYGTVVKTRQEAWNKAVEKADEFRNKQLEDSGL